MLSQQDADKIRTLKDELDDAQSDFDTATREAEAAENRLKQVRSSIRRASRTRFTNWLTNSDPEEYRRYRQAKEEQKDKEQLARYLEPRIAKKDASINAAVAECLKQSSREYQGLETQKRTATDDRRSCDEARAMTTEARRHVDAALAQVQRFRDRDTREMRKATTRISAEVAEEMSALKNRLTALVPRLRAYGSFSEGKIQQLRTEFSGGDTDFHSHLATTGAALNVIGNSLASASARIAERRHAFEKKQRALVQKARAQVLGS
jgi:chromosome segregation ATPase